MSQQFKIGQRRGGFSPTGDARRKEKPCHSRGFSLTEIMVVVAIVALMVGIAVPSFQKIRDQSRVNEFVNTLHMLRGAFQEYATMNRGYPAPSPAGVMPPGMTNFLPRNFNFAAPTPLGGNWAWFSGFAGGYAFAISVIGGNGGAPPLADSSLFLQADQQLDDGNLNTGSFRCLMSGVWYIYVLQQNANQPWGVKP